MTDPASDPTVQRLRKQNSEIDRAIVDAVNTRLELVGRLKRYKETQGIPFLDPERERQLLDDVARANRGPLSGDGLHELYAGLLDLTKREVTGEESA